MRTLGVRALGISLPEYYLDLADLARIRGVDPDKYRVGLGCLEMAYAPPQKTIVPYMVEAVRRAMARSPVTWEEIGMIVVGTESGLDHSRPLSSFILEAFEKKGRMQSFEIKHACYGGTVALLHAFYWVASGANRGKSALVVMGDLARYAPRHPGEPTQGGGAIAMVVGEGKEVLSFTLRSWPYTEPAWDFYKPLKDPYPRVDGPLSLECYMRSAVECFSAFVAEEGYDRMERAGALCFHVPYPKMVYKTLQRLKASLNLSEETYERILKNKVEPFLRFNRRIGNLYTASLWVSVATALADLAPGEEILAFSYGSGLGSELLLLEVGEKPEGAYWVRFVEEDIERRERISPELYEAWRREEEILFSQGAVGVTASSFS
jgi:hydroxymethylglutaryl-CoA synthase